MKSKFISLLLIPALILTACGSAIPGKTSVVPPAVANASTGIQPATESLARTDGQGEVTVEVIPLDLDQPGQTLDFQVSMNTHSVDLSMDLATLATLTTDNGNTVQAISWDGPKGGHHVSGKLTFPAITNGVSLLAGASQLTLTLKNVDADTRLFTWTLSR